MTGGTFQSAGEARTFAAIHGLNFDNQDDYCEACDAHHVGYDHSDAVPVECGSMRIHGFNIALDCNRPPHDDDRHRTVHGTAWRG